MKIWPLKRVVPALKDGAALVALVLFTTVALFWSATVSAIVSTLRAGGLQ